MALQQPALRPTSRRVSGSVQIQSLAPARLQDANVADSQEWILFPRTKPLAPTTSNSTAQAPLTSGLSRLSDYGSLNSFEKTTDDRDLPCQASFGSAAEDEELDSLAEGLHAFHEHSFSRGLEQLDVSGSVLPRHDGLGTFQSSNAAAQDQIWHFERHNPNRLSTQGHQRRPSSVKRKLDEIDELEHKEVEQGKFERIEQWRLHNSQFLLDEIEKETRRRISIAKTLQARQSNASGGHAETQVDSSLDFQQGGEHEQATELESESVLEKISRRVIRNFLGINDETLAVLFGEDLPVEDDMSSSRANAQGQDDTASWQSQLLNRLARELGNLLDQIYDTPRIAAAVGSLSDPVQADYAGMPITQPTSSHTTPQGKCSGPILTPRPSNFALRSQDTPTIPPMTASDPHQASHWGVEDVPTRGAQPASADVAYWSQSPNLSNVLSVFRTHLRASTATSHAPTTTTTRSPDALRRAAVIRQQHPLVNRTAQQRSSRQQRSVLQSSRLRYSGYAGSSCGSQSWRNGRWASTMSTTTANSYGKGAGGSERNFWDLGASQAGSAFDGAGVWGAV